MRDFVAIDFETANECASSVCSIGAVLVRNGEIVKNLHLLGGKAIIFAVMTVLCSIIAVYIFSRLFLEKGDEK